MNTDKGYVFKFLLYFDIFFQSLIWRDPGITISARCGMAMRKGYPWGWVFLGKILNKIEKDHCFKAIEHDRERAQQVLDTLK